MDFKEARNYLIANFEFMNLESVIKILGSLSERYEPNYTDEKFSTNEFVALHKALEILMVNQQESKAQKSTVTFEVEDSKKARITFEDLSDY